MLSLIVMIITFSGVYPEGKPLEITTRHDLGFERDTVIATHWHRVDNKIYVLTKDSLEVWCDNAKEIKQLK